MIEAPAEPVIGAETSAEPPPVEEARSAPAPVPTQDEAAEPTETIVSEAAPIDTAISDEEIAAGPEDGPSPSNEDMSMIEAPGEPIIVEPVQPVIAANPASSPQQAPAAPSEPTFVPDSSFFDQLLEQVD